MNFNPKMYRSVTHGVIKPRCSLTASDLLRHVSAVVLLVTDPGLRNTTSVLAGKLVGLTGLSWTGQDRTGQDRTGQKKTVIQCKVYTTAVMSGATAGCWCQPSANSLSLNCATGH